MLNSLKLSFFGESHGSVMGFTIDGLPAGFEINEFLILEDLLRRRPKDKGNTPRIEEDKYEFVSGFFNGKTTGAPLTVIVGNNVQNSKDYNVGEIRPSHADYPAFIKYAGFHDYRGGGIFSGRLTVLHVIAGNICKQMLAQYNIIIGSEVTNVNGLENVNLIEISEHNLKALPNQEFPSLNESFIKDAYALINDARENEDSVGGKVTTYAINLPIGLGSSFFNNCESRIAHMFFSIPSVKGVSFGEGENFANLYGSEANDELYYDNGELKFKTNNAGGINGGLTNGQPLVINTVFKAPSSIAKVQDSINLMTKENIQLSVKGRHDACILNRVCVVLDNALAIVLLDLVMESNK